MEGLKLRHMLKNWLIKPYGALFNKLHGCNVCDKLPGGNKGDGAVWVKHGCAVLEELPISSMMINNVTGI